MENQEKGLTVNIGEYKGEKPIEVVYRIGNAPKALDELPIKQPESISVSGVIRTPLDWLEKRIDTIDQKRANVKVNREKMSITLTVNEDDYYTKNTFVGTVELSEVFSKFGINNGECGWIPAKLGQFLRLNRGVFMQKEDCMKLVSVLKNFTANAKTEIQKQRDPSGSMAEVYRSQVESNLPKSFTINISIFKGTAKHLLKLSSTTIFLMVMCCCNLFRPVLTNWQRTTEISVLMRCWTVFVPLPQILLFLKSKYYIVGEQSPTYNSS